MFNMWTSQFHLIFQLDALCNLTDLWQMILEE